MCGRKIRPRLLLALLSALRCLFFGRFRPIHQCNVERGHFLRRWLRRQNSRLATRNFFDRSRFFCPPTAIATPGSGRPPADAPMGFPRHGPALKAPRGKKAEDPRPAPSPELRQEEGE